LRGLYAENSPGPRSRAVISGTSSETGRPDLNRGPLVPQATLTDGSECLYMQDTWLVTAAGGAPLACLPMRIFDGSERKAA
jgi:hypothetical protein